MKKRALVGFAVVLVAGLSPLRTAFSQCSQDHFTGSLELRGWGWGHISTFNRTSNPYATPGRLLDDLVDDAYVFVHLGWHEIRPECTGQPGAEVR